MRSISIGQEAGYGRQVMCPIPASRRSSPARGDARKGVPYRDPFPNIEGLRASDGSTEAPDDRDESAPHAAPEDQKAGKPGDQFVMAE